MSDSFEGRYGYCSVTSVECLPPSHARCAFNQSKSIIILTRYSQVINNYTHKMFFIDITWRSTRKIVWISPSSPDYCFSMGLSLDKRKKPEAELSCFSLFRNSFLNLHLHYKSILHTKESIRGKLQWNDRAGFNLFFNRSNFHVCSQGENWFV